MCYRSCDVRILGPKMVRSVQFVCNKIGKCLCETCVIGCIVKAVQTEACRHSRLLAAHKDKGLKIKRPKVAAAIFWDAARRRRHAAMLTSQLSGADCLLSS
jgi:hypothetical protein